MKFMIAWKIPPGCYKPAIEAFLSGGAPVPPGLTLVGRWHTPGSASGWLLLEGNDGPALAQFAAEWSSVCELEISPVIEDAEAAKGLSKVFKK
jgi:hypothetical protein